MYERPNEVQKAMQYNIICPLSKNHNVEEYGGIFQACSRSD